MPLSHSQKTRLQLILSNNSLLAIAVFLTAQQGKPSKINAPEIGTTLKRMILFCIIASLYVCLSVCLSVYLPVCVSLSVSVCLCACLHVCLPVSLYLSFYLTAYLTVYFYNYSLRNRYISLFFSPSTKVHTFLLI